MTYFRFNRKYGRYCGRIPAWTLYGTNTSMTVIAHTDYDVEKYGFRAVYQVRQLSLFPVPVWIVPLRG